QRFEIREVPMTTLDHLRERHGWGGPFGLKIDAEGFEPEVIEGAERLLQETQFVIAEVSVTERFEDDHSFARFIAWIDSRGFALVKSLAHGTPRIDRYNWETRDEAYYRGHYYSVKAPGLAAVSVPLYKVLRGLGMQSVSREASKTARDHGAGRWVAGSLPLGL